jgi:hypothetical protein
MNKELFIFPILVIGLAVWLTKSKPPEISGTQETEIAAVVQQPEESVNSLAPQTLSFGAVEAEVTPKQVTPSLPIIFSVSLNTHSVELDFDLPQITELKDDQGNIYQAKEWTGGQSGHHLSGDLTFENLKPEVKELKLTINSIDQIIESFVWNL